MGVPLHMERIGELSQLAQRDEILQLARTAKNSQQCVPVQDSNCGRARYTQTADYRCQ